ncbi:RNA polymerase Rpc34 [Lepidopterella palustris CBS 459.81]|uniref:DNA-directed RNA polymerase III subunit RPC6 n=1 Tax=Lepidopterella palustris CBS 459.81 TaxID=1314670 RepID=A0A8E2EEY4_9PEZI|nr:RNA polymerase Rpc34 [Lepidopterella palustris CBS 459.81]
MASSSNTMFASKKDQLYEKCAESPLDTIFYQRDFNDMHVAEDGHSLMVLIQQLLDAHLLQVMTWDGQQCYKIRSRDEAAKLKSMTPDERLIFAAIDNAQINGIWTRTLRAKTGVSQTIMTKCLKTLETKGLIKPISSVKYPSRKLYMLAQLTPAEDIVGGPWHQDGELDVDLIEAVSEIVVRYVESESWVEMKAPSKAVIARKKAEVLAAKAARPQPPNTVNSNDNIADIETEPPIFRPPLGPHGRPLIPHPPTFKHYPTCVSILNYIKRSGVINENVGLQEPDLQMLLDDLVFDGKLERMGATGYRSVRGAVARSDGMPEVEVGNGFSQAPCGRCPVFALCDEAGPVNARTCVYFREWLRGA